MESVTPRQAEALIGAHLARLPIESLPVAQCAGAVLRENVYAERDQPPFDRVAVDGVALDSQAIRQGRLGFTVQDTHDIGSAQLVLHSAAHCIQVRAGAMLPAGCDTVVPGESVHGADGRAQFESAAVAVPWRHVQRRASEQTQGALLLADGTALRAPEIAIAASAGMARLRVSGQPAILVVSTGSELVEPGDPLQPHQIRRSNAYALMAALRQRGFSRVADDHLPDHERILLERLQVHLHTHDVLVLSGGLSPGRGDLLPKVLQQLGVQRLFHGIAQRPGEPMWFGTTTDARAVFALPGNPVSTLVCLARYVLPALYAAMGLRRESSEKLALAGPCEWDARLTGYLPVRVHHDDWGRPWATPHPTSGAGDYGSLASTDGFVELPPGPASFARGFVTRLYRW